MPIYQFDCNKCKISFEVDGEMSNPPQRRKCPKCEKQVGRAIIAPKFAISGKAPKMDKTDVDKAYKEMIADSKKNLKNRIPYSRYDFKPTEKEAEKHGARRLTPDEINAKVNIAKDQTAKTNEMARRTGKIRR